ncbi:36265_t:CDS:2 [Racocetra persica]|uniref:36265_t:CDS:1 n=1 Tax=Racocetra persica TaxID=160502 RepID=A0ACA9QEA3_9GLOM|nr:36265_t:CDS:2 [Racocetra persica]
MSFTKKETQNENKSLAKPQSSFLESLARMLPLLTLTFEQFTGQPIPQMSGTIADIAASLLQIQQTQQTILQKITDLEKNCAEQFIHQEQQLTSLQKVSALVSTEKTKAIHFANPKTGSIAIGLAAGYALYKFGILQKLLKGVGQMFRKKDENSDSSNSQSTSI